MAVLTAVENFFFIPYYPFWSILVIALCVWVIWALTRPGATGLLATTAAHRCGARRTRRAPHRLYCRAIATRSRSSGRDQVVGVLGRLVEVDLHPAHRAGELAVRWP